MKKVLVILLILTASASAGNLKDIIRLGIENNPELKVYRQRMKISNYEYREAISDFFPKASISYSSVDISKSPSFPFSIPGMPEPMNFDLTRRKYYDLSLQVKQPIFTGGYLYYRAKAKHAIKKASYYELLEELNGVVNTIKDDYYFFLRSRISVKVAEEYVQSAKSHLEDTLAFFNQGIVPRRDLLEAQVKLRQAEENLERAKGAYNVSLEKLRKDVGVSVNPNGDNLTFKRVRLSEKELLRTAFERRPILTAARLGCDEGRYGVKLSYSQFLPHVEASFSYDRTNQYPLNGNFHSKTAAVGISFPIFEGFQRFWKVEESRSRLLSARANLKKLKDAVKLQVLSSYYDFKVAESQVETARAMVKEAKQLLSDSNERYREHVGTSTDVTDAIAYYFNAKQSLVSALANYNKALSDLEFAIGGSI